MKIVLFAGLCLLGLSSCKRFAAENFDAYFWTSTKGIKMYLYIEGQKKGELPYLDKAPDCDDAGSKLGALKLDLPSDTYLIEVKDEAGGYLFSEELKIWKRGGNISLGNTQPNDADGGARRTFKGNCLIEELFYKQARTMRE
ncbi:MAG: hypothetical protein DI535_20680 [Citrobacter freundii]|nr:MAG: hypothetical protein DI535_20680 [Citrobacter freundii]